MNSTQREKIQKIALDQANAQRVGKSNIVSGGTETYSKKEANKLESIGSKSAGEDPLIGAGIINTPKKRDLSKIKAVEVKINKADPIETLEKELVRADERLVELNQLKDSLESKIIKYSTTPKDRIIYIDNLKNTMEDIKKLEEKMKDPRVLRKREKEKYAFESIIPLEKEIERLAGQKKEKSNRKIRPSDPRVEVLIKSSGDREKIDWLDNAKYLYDNGTINKKNYDGLVFDIYDADDSSDVNPAKHQVPPSKYHLFF